MSADDRDDALGAALRALEVPEYEPGFEARLRALLDSQTPKRPLRSRPRRRPAFGRTGSRAPRVWRSLATGLALAGIVLAVVLSRDSGVPGPAGLGTPPATAAELGERVARAVAQARSLGGVLVWRTRFGNKALPIMTERTRFLVTAAGDLRLTPLGTDAAYKPQTAYRAATATATQLTSRAPYAANGVITVGLPPGPPDDAVPSERVLDPAIGANVPTLIDAGDRRIESTSYAGRAVWRVRTPVRVNAQDDPRDRVDHVEIIVDQQTGFPLRARETRHGRLLAEQRVEQLRVNAPAPASAFRLEIPKQAAGAPIDYLFRRVAPSQVAAVVRYAPLVPTRLPDGYERAETSVARETGAGGADGGNPVSRDIVSTAYRRGLRLVIVTTRRRDPGTPACSPSTIRRGPCWEDPFRAGAGYAADEQPVQIGDGALKGSRARIVINPRAIPHVWALTSNLVVTISGDLSRQQLIDAAGSLRPQP